MKSKIMSLGPLSFLIVLAACGPVTPSSSKPEQTQSDNVKQVTKSYGISGEDPAPNDIAGMYYVKFNDADKIRLDESKKRFVSLNKSSEVSQLNLIIEKYKINKISCVVPNLDEDEAQAQADAVNTDLRNHGLKPDYPNPLSTYYLQFGADSSTNSIEQELNSLSFVILLEKVSLAKASGTSSMSNQWAAPPSDPMFSSPHPVTLSTSYPGNDSNYYHFNRHGVFKGWQYYNYWTGKTVGADVAVIDSDFTQNPLDPINYDTSYDATTNAGKWNTSGGVVYKTTTWATASPTHGGKVASVIGAQRNTIGWCGVAPNVKIYPSATDQTTPAVEVAIREIADHTTAKVINISLGYYDDTPIEKYSVIKSAIQYANSKGITTVIAAGNGGYAFRIADYDSSTFSRAIVVGSLSKLTGKENPQSTVGTRLDVSAAGDSIPVSDTTYTTFSGTSAAAPIVTGLVSYLYGIDSNLDPYKVAAILEASSDIGHTSDFQIMGSKMGDTSVNISGYGSRMVDFNTAMNMLAWTSSGGGNGYSIRAFNADDNTQGKHSSGSWSFSLVNAGFMKEALNGGTYPGTGLFNFAHLNTSGTPRTYGGSLLRRNSSGITSAVKSYGFVKRVDPDGTMLWDSISSDFGSVTGYFDLSI